MKLLQELKTVELDPETRELVDEFEDRLADEQDILADLAELRRELAEHPQKPVSGTSWADMQKWREIKKGLEQERQDLLEELRESQEARNELREKIDALRPKPLGKSTLTRILYGLVKIEKLIDNGDPDGARECALHLIDVVKGDGAEES